MRQVSENQAHHQCHGTCLHAINKGSYTFLTHLKLNVFGTDVDGSSLGSTIAVKIS